MFVSHHLHSFWIFILYNCRMIVYRDIITGDEMLSDAFPLKPVVDSDGNTVICFLKRRYIEY